MTSAPVHREIPHLIGHRQQAAVTNHHQLVVRPRPRRRAQEYGVKTTIVHTSTANQMSALLCTHPANPQAAVHATSDIDSGRVWQTVLI
jgi:hypothetical protein